jgi:hypothetical protein
MQDCQKYLIQDLNYSNILKVSPNKKVVEIGI